MLKKFFSRRFWFRCLLVCAFAANARAGIPKHSGASSAHPLGLGIILGEPTGLTGKYWKNPATAYDIGLSYSLSSFFLLYGDYLHHFRGGFGRSTRFLSELNPYVGLGAVVFLSTDSRRTSQRYFSGDGGTAGLGLRIPLGIEWLPSNMPFGLFLELVPGLGLLPSSFGFVEGGVGARYYF